MVDTSKEAVEKFIQGPLKDAVLSEGLPTTSEDTSDVYRTVELLRALSAERDAAQGDNRILRTEKHADAEAIATLRDINAENDRLRVALKISEAALSDIGDADREDGDDLAWCERRAAKAIPTARAALRTTTETNPKETT
jgi:hypothetical protein